VKFFVSGSPSLDSGSQLVSLKNKRKREKEKRKRKGKGKVKITFLKKNEDVRRKSNQPP